jgi:hypothetical protein
VGHDIFRRLPRNKTIVSPSSTYVPSQATVIELTDPNAYFNDVPVNFGPGLFDIMNGMYDKAGAMDFIIGLSMRDPEAWGDVVELALAAEAKLGDRLDSMLLGNVGEACATMAFGYWLTVIAQEPDLYAGHGERTNYTIQDYVRIPLCWPRICGAYDINRYPKYKRSWMS